MLKAKVRGTYITMMLNVLHKKQNGLQERTTQGKPTKNPPAHDKENVPPHGPKPTKKKKVSRCNIVNG
jgi:hypothetical protein